MLWPQLRLSDFVQLKKKLSEQGYLEIKQYDLIEF